MDCRIELAYACTAWGDHVLAGGITAPFQERIRNFVEEKRVLYWIEALSALKNVKYGYDILWEISKVSILISEILEHKMLRFYTEIKSN